MRNKFLIQLEKSLNVKTDYFLTADVGYGYLDPIAKKMKKRFINVGLREQAMIGMATGLALSGYRVFTYTMCCFYLRALEQIRNDVYYHQAHVHMIGGGIGKDYGSAGFTHWAKHDGAIIRTVGVNVCTIKNKKDMDKYFKFLKTDKNNLPLYIRLKK